ncbi:ENTH domain-containing protein [Pseudocercospora fijiensis CIRAD86]|uniref:ENTH domain-containing protein n=1 Tax=Pseudocercospora fijiensis (strain CIRAD86) TaxID=383855 RepID=N1Q877_PSEFD|nr:ENTH domain-containing protein [Pseudocercospora fijiensis CIRAD86]EME89060.1 ENTH domain-containing protein [Pseudocercospora fijiensis CIRAD86]
MSSSFEKSVKGGTKVKAAPPKSKYVEHILLATQSGEAGVAEVFRTLTHRLRDSTWTVAFKALIIVHLMIKEGVQDVTLSYLAVAPRNRLAINSFTDVQTQGQNIRVYSEYLLSRAVAYERSKCDFVRSGEGRMKRLTVDKGLLRETEVVQSQIKALVRCDLLSNDVENEISLTAFRLLTRDLLDLYNVENEAVMNVLSHYFEMSRPDAERSIAIYKNFCKQTEQVVQYLSVARQYEYATRLEIPKLKHAPTSLAASLQEYLDDPDFEINRRQYLAELESRKGGKPFSRPAQSTSQTAAATATMKTPFDDMKSGATPAANQPAKGPAPDLIDFFQSIESNQQTSETNPFLQQQAPPQQQLQPMGLQQPYQTGAPQPMNGYGTNGAPTNPYQQQPMQQAQPLQTQFTGAGFGGYGPQPEQQAFAPAQQYLSPVQAQTPAQIQPQTTNPFRQSMMATGTGGALGSSLGQQSLNRQSTNPFAKSAIQPIPENGPSPVAMQQQATSPFASQATSPQPLVPQATGSNPFRQNIPSSQPALLQVQATGSTNPFRQSQFVNQQTGSGWQHGPQATMGGLEHLETVPVFPRPGQNTPQQQSPWG